MIEKKNFDYDDCNFCNFEETIGKITLNKTLL